MCVWSKVAWLFNYHQGMNVDDCGVTCNLQPKTSTPYSNKQESYYDLVFT